MAVRDPKRDEIEERVEEFVDEHGPDTALADVTNELVEMCLEYYLEGVDDGR